MDDDQLVLSDLAPVRRRTSLLGEIERLSEERRRLLRALASARRDGEARGRLAEIERKLDQLWAARRRELRRPPLPGNGLDDRTSESR